MSNLHPIKIIRINLKEQIQQNKESKRKKIELKRIRTKFETKRK
jgi:hypothetical protein